MLTDNNIKILKNDNPNLLGVINFIYDSYQKINLKK
jgi:hypothetical protein